MNELMLELLEDRTSFRPGERLEVVAEWKLEALPEAVEIRLRWRTVGKGQSDESVVDSVRLESPGATGSRRCSFKLPKAPYSFSGKLISLIWSIELDYEPGDDDPRRVDFVLSPTGKEVILTPIVKARE